MEKQHVLFMTDDQDRYIDKLFARLRGSVDYAVQRREKMAKE